MAMRIIRNILGLWCVAVAVCLPPAAASGTSLYSMNFIGERLEAGDARAIALGGATQLLYDSLGVVSLNPALLVGCRKVTVGATQFVAFDQGRSKEFNERDVSVIFSVFRLAVPIGNRLTLAVGYTGRYDPDGTFEIPGVTSAGDTYVDRFRKTGGLFSVPFTASILLSRFVSVGLTYSLERGFVSERWDVEFSQGTLAPGAGLKKEELSGSGVGAGVVLFPGSRLMIGGMYEGPVDYEGSVEERFTQSTLDSAYTEDVELPARASVGVTWRVGPDVIVLASATWSDFEGFEGLGFSTGRLTLEQSYALGVEYGRGVPVRGRRFPIRASFNYQELPYEHPQGEAVRKFLVGLGTGVLIQGGKGKLDIALQVGRLGSMTRNGLEDRLFRITVGVSGSEIWKRKGERKY